MFLAHLREVMAASPGCLGAAVLTPTLPDREFVVVYRYDSAAALRRWRRSPERAQTIAESAALTEATPQERSLSGLETWFTTPGAGVVPAPPRWKVWLLSTVGIYPIITLVTILFGPALAAMSAPVRFAVVAPVLSATMTWLIMPALSRAFRWFLYPQRRHTDNWERRRR